MALYESGIDPVIAGLAIGLVTSAYPPPRHELERATDLTREFREQPTPGLASTARRSLAQAISPNERIQYALHPWTSYVIVPLFALANAGVHITGGLLSDAVTSPITIGIVAAYVVGKPLGIFLVPWLATRAPVRKMVGGGKLTITWPGLLGTGTAAGVGFTVSFLIASLAFTGPELDEAKIGVLAACLISPLIAFAVFHGTRKLIPQSRRLEQLRRTAESIIDLDEDVDPERDHIRGDPNGAVTLVEYADFECPYCGRAEPTIRELLGMEHKGGLRYVFRHLPLQDVHPHAQLAAEASEAAAAQGAFWPMHDTLMAHQGELDLDDVHRYADELELDADKLEEEVRTRVYLGAGLRGRVERRLLRRLRHADLLHQRPPPPGRLRHRGADQSDPPRQNPRRRGSESAGRQEAGEGSGEGGAGAREGGPRLMASWADVEAIAGGLEEVEEGTSYGNRAWKVGGKLFVWERPLRKKEVEGLGGFEPEGAAPAGEILGVRVPDEGAKRALVELGTGDLLHHAPLRRPPDRPRPPRPHPPRRPRGSDRSKPGTAAAG